MIRLFRAVLGLAALLLAGGMLHAAPTGGRGEAIERDGSTRWPESREFAAALLAETNRVRRAHRLRPLAARRELDLAADDHAAFLGVTWTLQHSSPIPGQETPSARVYRRRVAPGTVAENAAACNVNAGPEQESVDAIAAKLVAQWMDSPGHRANILNRSFTHVGGAVRVVRVVESWRAYGVQVFYAPARQFAAR